MSEELFEPLMYLPAPHDTLRAPASRGESPAGAADDSTALASAWSDEERPASAAPEDDNWIPYRSVRSSRSSLTLERGDLSSLQAVAEEGLSSPVVRTEEHVSTPTSSEENLLVHSDESLNLTTSDQSGLAASPDSGKLRAIGRHSPVTPELRRPLLSHSTPRDLELPDGESPAPSPVSATSDAGAVPGTPQSVLGTQSEQSVPSLTPEAVSVENYTVPGAVSVAGPAARTVDSSSRIAGATGRTVPPALPTTPPLAI